MNEVDPIRRMAERVAQCRRLASATTDARTAAILNQMAEEGEQDLERLRAERGANDAESSTPPAES